MRNTREGVAPHHHAILPPPKCEVPSCSMEDDKAQGQDPKYCEVTDIALPKTLDNPKITISQRTKCRKRKSNNSVENLKQSGQTATLTFYVPPKVTRTTGVRKHTPLRPYNLPQQESYSDTDTRETWICFNPRVHQRLGRNMIKMI